MTIIIITIAVVNSKLSLVKYNFTLLIYVNYNVVGEAFLFLHFNRGMAPAAAVFLVTALITLFELAT